MSNMFVGRRVILDWINETLALNPPMQKIEETAAAACWVQLCHAIWPDTPLHRVNFDAKLEHERINNFKLLQEVLSKHGEDRLIEIDRLSKARFQDNLAFAQWFYGWWVSQVSPDAVYDAYAERETARQRNRSLRGAGRRTSRNPEAPSPVARRPRPAAPAATTTTHAAAPAARPMARPARPVNTVEVSALKKKVAELEDQLVTLTTERDFYFSKLRRCEIAVQDQAEDEHLPLCTTLFEIMYCEEEPVEDVLQDVTEE